MDKISRASSKSNSLRKVKANAQRLRQHLPSAKKVLSSSSQWSPSGCRKKKKKKRKKKKKKEKKKKTMTCAEGQASPDVATGNAADRAGTLHTKKIIEEKNPRRSSGGTGVQNYSCQQRGRRPSPNLIVISASETSK